MHSKIGIVARSNRERTKRPARDIPAQAGRSLLQSNRRPVTDRRQSRLKSPLHQPAPAERHGPGRDNASDPTV